MVAAVLVAGSEKAAAYQLGLSRSTMKHHLASARARVGAVNTAQLVGILAPRLPGPGAAAQHQPRDGRADLNDPRSGGALGGRTISLAD